ncbi:short-chain dehydrogenase, partial [Rhodococcus sp. BP-154]|nr:short-chain dehydrogenase [Rhodococcus sp. BP-154]
RNLPFPLRILTNLTAPLLAQPADRAALPSLRAATDPGVLGGQFYGPDGFLGQRGYPTVVTSTQASYDLEAQQRLWDVSEKLTDVEFGRLSV